MSILIARTYRLFGNAFCTRVRLSVLYMPCSTYNASRLLNASPVKPIATLFSGLSNFLNFALPSRLLLQQRQTGAQTPSQFFILNLLRDLHFTTQRHLVAGV